MDKKMYDDGETSVGQAINEQRHEEAQEGAAIVGRFLFGRWSRYCFSVLRTRGGHLEYFISDAEQNDPAVPSLPLVLLQTPDIEFALKEASRLVSLQY